MKSLLPHGPKTAFLLILPLLLMAVTVSLDGQSKPEKAKRDSNQAVYTRPTDPSLYVGSETCKTCHADMPTKDFFKNYEDSPHYVTTLDTEEGAGVARMRSVSWSGQSPRRERWGQN